jgi:hypothetical protein
MKSERNKRNDWRLTCALAALALVMMGVIHFLPRSAAAQVEIAVEGIVAVRFPFGEAREWTYEQGDAHVLVVSDASGVAIAASNCPDQLCVRQGPIRYTGAVRVCLPNRVAVNLRADAPGGLDALLR